MEVGVFIPIGNNGWLISEAAPQYMPSFELNKKVTQAADRYGLDFQVHYNIAGPKKGYMIHVLTASYPWYRVMVEEGGIPGIEWEDFQCVAFATETQKHELRLFQEQLRAAFATELVDI